MILPFLLQTSAAMPTDPRCSSNQNSDLIACAEAEQAASEAALNAQLSKAQAKATSDEPYVDFGVHPRRVKTTYPEALLMSQRAWLTYRDAQCGLETYPGYGARLTPMQLANCRTSLARKRTQELKEFTKGQ